MTLAQPFPSLGLFSLSCRLGPKPGIWKERQTRQPGQLRPTTQSVLRDCALNLRAPDDILGFPGGSAGKGSTCNAGQLGSIPGLGRAPGEGKGYPVQHSGLENSMDCIIRGVTNLCPTTAKATVEDPTRTCIQPEGNLPAPRWPQMVHPERERAPILGGVVCEPRQDNLKGCGESPSGSGIR